MHAECRNPAATSQQECLLNRLRLVRNQVPRRTARHQPSVRLVTAINKAFRHETPSSGASRGTQRPLRRAVKNRARYDGLHRRPQRLGQRGRFIGLMVKRPMRFHMSDLESGREGVPLQPQQLGLDRDAKRFGTDLKRTPAEIYPVLIAGMRPEGQALPPHRLARRAHGVVVAGMAPAGDIHRGDAGRHQGLVIPRPFSEVRIDIHD
ncbi:hypothetical protein IMCC26134_03250 [Verrucomicrobia bacterium IMCC26134]|nr:hypothetical protein IMCC26134_03250 [Verrucomicrobia bacterium IMCC26134]